jgi:uncharacterized protein YacL
MTEQHIQNKRVVYGGGKIGFGCGVILGIFIAIVIITYLFYYELPIWGMGCIAIISCIIFGYLGCKYGDPIFEKIIRIFHWL